MVGAHGILVVAGYVSILIYKTSWVMALTFFQTCAAWTGYGCYFESHPEIQWRLCLSLQGTPHCRLENGVVHYTDLR